MRIVQLLSPEILGRRVLGLTVRTWLPIIVVVLLIGGLLSPLFDLHRVHGFDARTYAQHFYFEFIAGLGGLWASAYSSRWYQRVPLFIAIDALTTMALVTIVG